MDYKASIKELTLERDTLTNRIAMIDIAIRSIQDLAGFTHVSPARVSVNGRARSTKSQPLFKASEHVEPTNGLVDTSKLSANEKKKLYMARWRQKKALAEGRPFKKRNQAVKEPSSQGNHFNGKTDMSLKFTLHREFDIANAKDLSLMHSYLTSWSGIGRLSHEEMLILASFQGRLLTSFAPAVLNNLRTLFYSCRDRIMDKAKQESKQESKSV